MHGELAAAESDAAYVCHKREHSMISSCSMVTPARHSPYGKGSVH